MGSFGHYHEDIALGVDSVHGGRVIFAVECSKGLVIRLVVVGAEHGGHHVVFVFSAAHIGRS